MNRNNDNNAAATTSFANNKGNNQNRGQAPMEPRPLLPNTPLPHQFQMQNPFGNSALRGNNFAPGLSMNPMNNLMPPPMAMPRMDFPANQQLDFQSLLQLGTQMMLGNNGLDVNIMGQNSTDDSHGHQSKMTRRQENRTHNQNTNYSRDKDRRNDRRRDRSRSRSRERQNDNWIRNRGRDNNRKNDRNDRGDNRGNNKNRRR